YLGRGQLGESPGVLAAVGGLDLAQQALEGVEVVLADGERARRGAGAAAGWDAVVPELIGAWRARPGPVAGTRHRRLAAAPEEQHQEVDHAGDQSELQQEAQHAGKGADAENAGEGRGDEAAHQDAAPAAEARRLGRLRRA